MKMSAGVEWSLHCCVVLSAATEPVAAHQLATLHDVPPAYLAKQLQALSRAGIVAAAQGQAGGYRLARAATDVTVLDVVRAVDGDSPAFVCTEIRQRGPLAAAPRDCTRPCAIARTMARAEQAWREVLGTVTLADLAGEVSADYQGDVLAGIRNWLGA